MKRIKIIIKFIVKLKNKITWPIENFFAKLGKTCYIATISIISIGIAALLYKSNLSAQSAALIIILSTIIVIFISLLLLSKKRKRFFLLPAVFLLLLYISVVEMKTGTLVIREIVVPEMFTNQHGGFAGQVIAWQLSDALTVWKNDGNTANFSCYKSADKKDLIKPTAIKKLNILTEAAQSAHFYPGIISFLKSSGYLKLIFQYKYYTLSGEITALTADNNGQAGWQLTLRLIQKMNRQMVRIDWDNNSDVNIQEAASRIINYLESN